MADEPDAGAPLPDGGNRPSPPPPDIAEIQQDAANVKAAATGLTAMAAPLLSRAGPVGPMLSGAMIGLTAKFNSDVDLLVAKKKAEIDAMANIPQEYKDLADQILTEANAEAQSAPTVPVLQLPHAGDEVELPPGLFGTPLVSPVTSDGPASSPAPAIGGLAGGSDGGS